MKEIQKSNLNNARNAEHFQFHADVLNVLKPEVAEAQHIGELRQTYASLFADEDAAFIQNQAYEATKEIEDKDKVRDDLFLYIKQTIESNLRCPLADKKDAAGKLSFALNPYRSANSRPYAENTAQITNFTSDMQSAAYTAYVSKLGLTEAIAELQTANDAFNAAYSGRSSEKLTRVSIDNMKAIRPKVDDAYRAVVSAINALYQVNELVARNAATSTALGTIIDGINALVIQLQQTLSHRGAGTKPVAPGGVPETPGSGSHPDAGDDPGEAPDPAL